MPRLRFEIGFLKRVLGVEVAVKIYRLFCGCGLLAADKRVAAPVRGYRFLGRFAALLCLFFIFGCALSVKASSKAEELKKKLESYRSEKGNSVSGLASVIAEKPTSRIISGPPPLSEVDLRHCRAYMKMANRSFAAKKYSKAIAELEKVFLRNPRHSGARFMRAVIAARMKDYAAAWHNAAIAQAQEPDNSKIQSLITKLETVIKSTDKTVGVPLVCRALPISICEKACDVIERFLSEQCSSNIISIDFSEPKQSGSVFKYQLTLKASAEFDLSDIVGVFKTACGGNVSAKAPTVVSGDNVLELEFEISGLPAANNSPKAASDLSEYINAEAEEADIVINDSSESEIKNNRLEVIYNLTTRDYKSLNTFLRRVSPYAFEFKIKSMKLDRAGASTIVWKCVTAVSYFAAGSS